MIMFIFKKKSSKLQTYLKKLLEILNSNHTFFLQPLFFYLDLFNFIIKFSTYLKSIAFTKMKRKNWDPLIISFVFRI